MLSDPDPNSIVSVSVHGISREDFDKLNFPEDELMGAKKFWVKHVKLGNLDLAVFCNEPPLVTKASEHESRGGEPAVEVLDAKT